MKYCKDCRWCNRAGFQGWVCNHPKIEEREDPVEGITTGHIITCRDERTDLDGTCGPEGKLWEAKPDA